MFGRVTRKKVCQPVAPSDSAASSSLRPCSVHQRDQLARDERKGDEDRRQHDAGHGEDDLDVMRAASDRAEHSPARRTTARRPAGHDRRHRERQIDQRDQQALAAEIELGDRPGAGDAEDGVERHRNRRDQQGQVDRRDAHRDPRARSTIGRRSPLRSASPNTITSGSSRISAEIDRSPRDDAARRGAPSARHCSGSRRRAHRQTPIRRCAQLCTRLIASRAQKGDRQHHASDGRRRAIIELLELERRSAAARSRYDRACCRR